MNVKKCLKNKFFNSIFGCFFALISLFAPLVTSTPVFADPFFDDTLAPTTEVTEPAEATTEENKEPKTCSAQVAKVGWVVCSVTEFASTASDFLYGFLEKLIVVKPITSDGDSPVYKIWQYCRDVTNIVFIIYLLIIVYSQITGIGISNYGIKKALPKLIIAAILVNVSYIICQLGIEISDIFGESLRSLFSGVKEATMGTAVMDAISLATVYSALGGGAIVAIGGITLAAETGAILMFIPTALSALVSIFASVVTMAFRQAIIILLVMIAPLAMVANIFPNTEQYFKKWKDYLIKMLIFFPVFSLLFGASDLAGWAIISSSNGDTLLVILGIMVQFVPLFFSWKLLKMSGTLPGLVGDKIRAIGAKPIAVNRAWADSHRQQIYYNTLANGTTPSARLMQYLEKRRALREEDIVNSKKTIAGKNTEYVQRMIAGNVVGSEPFNKENKAGNKYTRRAKTARNYDLIGKNAVSHTDHVLSNYGDYYAKTLADRNLAAQSATAFKDLGRAAFVKDVDDENDINFLTDSYLAANKRDAHGNAVDQEAYERYIRSVAGPNGEERVLAKIIAQAARVENKQRSEFAVLHNKFGHNGDNKKTFRSWVTGYHVDDDGWAVDANGKRLKDENGNYIELVQGDILTKRPDKLVLYDKRDEYGLYYDMKDQDGKVIARVHRGTGANGVNYDDAAFIKETLSNYDIPINDPINNVYNILAGVHNGDIVTPQGPNEIGLARYSTTIGRAMSNYKADASWAGAMFDTMVGNRQIKNSAQHAMDVLDSIKKTLKPGGFNTQNPASVKYVKTILDPDNWDKIFTEEEIMNAVNINNKPYGGEEWEYDENGKVIWENGDIKAHSVENPTYEQRMNTIKRKLIFPALKKILPALDRLRTSNTADNQKPGTADEAYELLTMVEEKWEKGFRDGTIPIDPTLVEQDLSNEARAFRARKHDRDGNLIYVEKKGKHGNSDSGSNYGNNLLLELEGAYENCDTIEQLKSNIFQVLDGNAKYESALRKFDELCTLYPEAAMSEVRSWFDDLCMLVD